MGTSGAYGGSGGRDWQAARDAVADLIADPTAAAQQAEVISQLADALDWDADAPASQLAPADQPPQGLPTPGRPTPTQQPFGGLVRPRGEAATVPAVVVVVVAAAQLAPERPAAVAGAQGSVPHGLAVRCSPLAWRCAPATPLRSTRSVSRSQSCRAWVRWRSALGSSTRSSVRAPTSMRRKCARPRARRWSRCSPRTSPTAAVRTFIVEYVMEITVTELGATMRENGTGDVSVQVEDGLRSLVTAQVDHLGSPRVDLDRSTPGRPSRRLGSAERC